MKFVLKNPTLYLATLAIGLVVLGVFSNTASAVASPAGAITLTFDDGNPSQYEIVAPILKAGGQPATFYINSGWLGVDEWYMTWDQVTDLHKNGFEIAGHTLNHIELPTVNNATKTTEINQDYQNFVAHGITPTNFAVPFGAYDNITTALVASRYNSLRAFANQGLNVWPYNKYLLYVRYVTNQTSLNQVQAWVEEAVEKDGWLIIVFHEILPVVDPTDDYSWETEKFQGFIDYLNAEGIKAKTVKEVLGGYINLVENSSFESGLTGWSTDNPTNVEVNMNSKGNYPNPKNSIKMIGSRKPAHLFGEKIPVTFGATYGFRAYTDSQSLSSGEVGFYIDEYDQGGNWISGKWLGGFTNKNVIDKAYTFTPTLESVKSIALQVYMTASSRGHVFIDNIEFFSR